MLPIQLKHFEIGLSGRDRLDFGTVRPRVQIPGPRPDFEFGIASSRHTGPPETLREITERSQNPEGFLRSSALLRSSSQRLAI